MAATDVQKNLVSKNADFVGKFGGLKDLPKAPSKHYVVVTCMDSRIDPVRAFGIDPGEAHVVRNAGASAADALRSILISHHMLGTVEVLVVKHTGCGMLTFDNKGGHELIEGKLGSAATPKAKEELDKVDLLPFTDLEAATKEDVKFLKDGGLLQGDVAVSGWIYDVTNGKVTQVA